MAWYPPPTGFQTTAWSSNPGTLAAADPTTHDPEFIP